MAISDVLVGMVVLFVLGIGIIMIYAGLNPVITGMQGDPTLANSSVAMTALSGATRAINYSDYVFLCAFIGIILMVIITSWLVAGNPLFLIIFILMMILGVAIGAAFSNAFETMAANPNLASVISVFPITVYIMSHLPYFVSVLGFISIIVTFAKPSITGGRQ